MPIFEIACSHCGFTGETLVRSADAPLTCPACGSGATRLEKT